MTHEDACEEIDAARNLIKIAYKILCNVEKKCPKKCCYPLKDVIIKLGTADMALVVIEDDYSKDDECKETQSEPR